MFTVLSITLPFFAIIFLGTIFHISNIFDNNSSKILTKYALYVTLPPFMFTNILKASDELVFNFNFIVCFEIVTIFILILSFLISFFVLKNSKKKSSLFSLNASYPNYGYMGIPLCILAFGEKASIPISLILLIDTIVLFSFTSFFIEFDKKKSLIFEIFKLFLNMLQNPILLASILGFLFVILNINIPIIFLTFLETLALAATPTALFAIGINIYNKIEIKTFNNIFIISIFRLIVHPLLIFIIFKYFSYDVPNLWINVAILASCLPVAGNVFAMSIYYSTFTKSTSGSILTTTILSTFSVPFILFLLLQ